MLAATFGLTYFVGNLWPYDTIPALAITLALDAAVLLSSALILFDLARGLPRPARRRFAALAVLLVAATALTLAYATPRGAEIGRLAVPDASEAQAAILSIGVAGFVITTVPLSLLVSACAFAYEAAGPSADARRKALALHACAYGLFVAFTAAFVFPSHLPLNLFLLVSIAPAASWAAVARDALARNVSLTLAAAGLGGVTLSLLVFERGYSWSTDFGIPGILRTAGAVALAFAILRHGLVGGDPHARAVRNGPLAMASLASLFIVAQVAQNFVSARSSLLIGGVISGLLVVAARPIERAFDRRSGPPVDGAARERSFRAAARKFHKRDGYLTREEERELMVIAEHLGISVGRAYEIRDEVETEARP